MLKVTDIESGYGKKQVLFGLSLEVRKGEIVALIGPNGAGKSTVLKTVCGLIQVWNGQILFNSEPIHDSTPEINVKRGITFVPQGSRVFADLTVQENLEIGGYQLRQKELRECLPQIFEMFPVLKERAKQSAGKLSGGEQQMLALARALVMQPKLLLLDEPSLGLAPNVVSDLFETITTLNKETGVTILIVEQKVREVLAICTRVYSLKLGRIDFDGYSNDLIRDNIKLKELFL